MPTEHEYKYVISLDMAKEYTEEQIMIRSREHRIIEQGVISHGPGMYLRIRRSVTRGKVEWFMTFKLKEADRTIEIENKIDARDAEDIWRKCYWKLKKDRYVIDYEGMKWEVDFFKNDGDTYFILAEVELPEGSLRPKRMPGFLQKHLLHEVPLTDDRFSNKRLGDVEYAKRLYNQMADQMAQIGAA
jgi:CYTH domain-containing protein